MLELHTEEEMNSRIYLSALVCYGLDDELLKLKPQCIVGQVCETKRTEREE